MTEMTPEMDDLRRVAGHLADIGEGSYCRRVDKALRAWEADRKRLEEAEAREGNLRAGYRAMADVFNNVIAALAAKEEPTWASIGGTS